MQYATSSFRAPWYENYNVLVIYVCDARVKSCDMFCHFVRQSQGMGLKPSVAVKSERHSIEVEEDRQTPKQCQFNPK